MTTKLVALRNRVLYENRISAGYLFTVRKINATFSVKAKGLLLNLFVRMVPVIGLEITKARVRSILAFIASCSSIHRAQGMKGLVLWLKANTVILQQALGGFKIKSMNPLKCRVKRTQAGLPRLILSQHRAEIRKGNVKMIKFYLTLFNLYRVLEFPGSLKLSTITAPFSGNPALTNVRADVQNWIKPFTSIVYQQSGGLILATRGIETPTIQKSGPAVGVGGISTSPSALCMTAFRLTQENLDKDILFFMKYHKESTKIGYPDLMAIFQDAANFPKTPEGAPWGENPLIRSISLGKLGLKEEAAGKIRVFAMVDAWTQWCLKPLHTELFRILDTFPMDGTHDQLRPLGKHTEWSSLDSLDLSAATDRLPAILQKDLLTELISSEYADHWYNLLINRDYTVKYRDSNKVGHIETIRYAVGQPMGALSSWAMLAYTHHFIVQCAAWHAGVVPVGTLFRDYAILGDDLVIGNSRVRRSYLLIVDALGVECGIAKSIISPKALAIEFAKRTFYKGQDVSPVPVLEFIMANLTLSEAVSLAKKYRMSFQALIRALGYGYRVLGNLNAHVGKLNSRVRALLFATSMPLNEEDAILVLSRGNSRVSPEQLGDVLKYMRDHAVREMTNRISGLRSRTVRSADAVKKYTTSFLEWFTNRYAKAFPILLVPNTKYSIELVFQSLGLLTLNQDTKDRSAALNRIEMTSKLKWSRSAFNIYTNLISTLRDINLYLPSNTEFKRMEIEVRKGRVDPTQIKIWKMFTNALLVSLKRVKSEELNRSHVPQTKSK
nr:putative RNA-dependent RNA polymerase [Binucleate Rhizoctonia mitovirus 4]